MTFLVDTNVVSEAGRKAPNQRVMTWLAGVGAFAMSVMSLDEIYYGLTLRPHLPLQRVLDQYLESFCIVHAVTPLIARHAGVLRGQLARKGTVRSQSDMLIAATAAAHGLTLATRNVRDFAGCGLELHNPFE